MNEEFRDLKDYGLIDKSSKIFNLNPTLPLSSLYQSTSISGLTIREIRKKYWINGLITMVNKAQCTICRIIKKSKAEKTINGTTSKRQAYAVHKTIHLYWRGLLWCWSSESVYWQSCS